MGGTTINDRSSPCELIAAEKWQGVGSSAVEDADMQGPQAKHVLCQDARTLSIQMCFCFVKDCGAEPTPHIRLC